MKIIHEFRDPIHAFVKVTTEERKIIDSKPFQRLRNINQLALTCLIYPGATHKRFEHSLGVMQLASTIYDILLSPSSVHPDIKRADFLPLGSKREYWRAVLRAAALCHDLGHLPFSHAAEEELLPDGWTHERMTLEIIKSSEVRQIFEEMTPPLNIAHVIKIAVGPREMAKIDKNIRYDDWEALLAEIIVGDIFGADRIDYLLRDSHHAGVAYGRFDHYRLIDTLRILPFDNSSSPKGDEAIHEKRPCLGIEAGGLHSAEALLLARYFMFTQLYYHEIRRIYDKHLNDYLKKMFPCRFPINVEDYLQISDNEILSAIYKDARDKKSGLHKNASLIACREHFKLLYQRIPEDETLSLSPGLSIYKAACKKYGEDNCKLDNPASKNSGPANFPVLIDPEKVVSAVGYSQVLDHIPRPIIDFVFISREHYNEAEKWLEKNREGILKEGPVDD